SQQRRISRRLHWIRSWFYISGRVVEELGDAASGRPAQGNSSRFGGHRRCANRNLSGAFSGRLESDRAHSLEAFRSLEESTDTAKTPPPPPPSAPPPPP